MPFRRTEQANGSPPRVLTLWCPDWPLFGVGLGNAASDSTAAVMLGERVFVATPAARAQGVRRGLRQREAQRRCPDLLLVERDEPAEMRAFEPVLRAIDEHVCPSVEVVRPGLCLFETRGPSRYFGNDTALSQAVAAAVITALPDADPSDATGCSGARLPIRIGIAEGPFAAEIAARRSSDPDHPTIVDAGQTPAFLSPFPVEILGRPDLVHLLRRLGLRTLGDLAALPRRTVASRFGAEGSRVHRLASGTEHHPVRPLLPPEELEVREELDPPEERVEPLAFVAKMLADRLQEQLSERGLGCTRLFVEAESEHGEIRSRQWRNETSLTASAVAGRVRWQLEGWLTGEDEQRPTAGITLLRIIPTELHQEDGDQLRLFGGPTDGDGKAAAAITRLQGLLGFDAVYGADQGPGREPGHIRLAPWGEQRSSVPPTSKKFSLRTEHTPLPPWPGRLPAPHPSILHPEPVPVDVVDRRGKTITLTERGVVSGEPARLINGRRTFAVVDWSAPWPVRERWWDPAAPPETTRLQLLTADGSARLIAHRHGRWWIEGEYE